MSGVIIVGAKCERCRVPDDSGRITDTFLNRNDGDTFHTICKNTQTCAERRAAEKVRTEPSVSVPDDRPA
jgi:hypothetical protein